MSEVLSAARRSIEATERTLEEEQQREIRRYGVGLGLSDYHQRRTEITEQWLQLAAIEQGLNPFQSTSTPAGVDTTDEQRVGGGW
jgi:hypothetical protein